MVALIASIYNTYDFTNVRLCLSHEVAPFAIVSAEFAGLALTEICNEDCIAMQLNAISLVPFLMIIKVGIAVVYDNNTVVNGKVLLYKNPRFSLKVIGEGDDSQLFMTIGDPIREQDNLLLNVIILRSDGAIFSLEDDFIRLCQLLSDEATGSNEKITQFRLSRAFSLEETKCPIPAGTKRLMPYMFPPKLSLQNDIGCGTFTYKATIMSCQGQKSDDCVPYITASTDVYLHGDHCSNTLM